MLSRVAENLYWMARYLERAENTARLINSTTQVLLDLPRGASLGWDELLKIVGLDEIYAEHHESLDEASLIRFLILDEKNPSSIVASISNARENTRTFREVLPMEIWERVNRFYLYVHKYADKALAGRGPRYEFLTGVIEWRQSIVGLLVSTMSQDIAYQFIKLGRNIERADMTTRIVDVNSAILLPNDDAASAAALERLWVSTLNALSAYPMYRRHIGVHVEGEPVLEFLLKNPHFPRSVVHCLSEIETCLSVLPQFQEPIRTVRRAWKRVAGVRCADRTPAELHASLDQIQTDLVDLNASLNQQYFHRHHRLAERPVGACAPA